MPRLDHSTLAKHKLCDGSKIEKHHPERQAKEASPACAKKSGKMFFASLFLCLWLLCGFKRVEVEPEGKGFVPGR